MDGLGYVGANNEGDDADDGSLSRQEKESVVVKAWLQFVEGASITQKSLRLEYTTDKDGVRTLDETPTVGGIDTGGVPPEEVEPDPSPEEIGELASNERSKRSSQ